MNSMFDKTLAKIITLAGGKIVNYPDPRSARTSDSTRCEPINPAPPVTKQSELMG